MTSTQHDNGIPREVRQALGRLASAVGYQSVGDVVGVHKSQVCRWINGETPLPLAAALAVPREFQGVEWSADVQALARAMADVMAELSGASGTGEAEPSDRALVPAVSGAVAQLATLGARAAEFMDDGVLDPAEAAELHRRLVDHVEELRPVVAQLDAARKGVSFVNPSGAP